VFNIKAIRKNSIKQSLRGGAVFLLLCFFLLGNVEIEAIHQFVHSHNTAVTHSKDVEKDLCHRSIYHGEVKNGCAHKSHITKSDKCEWCGINFQTDEVVAQCALVAFVAPSSLAQKSIISSQLPQQAVIKLKSRAPPII
jgi:hypothetical protein